jgi:peptidoglycan/xylan/chitin deacetylase (PgdA/CDA1 family)
MVRLTRKYLISKGLSAPNPYVRRFLFVFRILLPYTLLWVFTVTGWVSSQPSTLILESQPEWDGTLRRIRVPILMYHYVSELPPGADATRIDLTVSPNLFRAHMRYLSEQGYQTVSLYQLDAALRQGIPLPAKPIILTFDDGYVDHYQFVMPVLQQHGFVGTFFIITARADANDPRYMSWSQIREMADAGMSMEAHTKNHVDLRDRSYDFLIYEMLGSMESLAAYVGRQSHMFAYPVGHYDTMTLQVGEQLPIWRAVTTQSGALHTTDNRLELPRLRIHGNTTVSGLEAILQTR